MSSSSTIAFGHSESGYAKFELFDWEPAARGYTIRGTMTSTWRGPIKEEQFAELTLQGNPTKAPTRVLSSTDDFSAKALSVLLATRTPINGLALKMLEVLMFPRKNVGEG